MKNLKMNKISLKNILKKTFKKKSKKIKKKVSVKKAEISSEESMKNGAYLIFFIVPLCTFLVSPTKAYSKVYSASFVDKISIRIGRLS